jgi:uncharacterized protein GlcG (DUF336 family)
MSMAALAALLLLAESGAAVPPPPNASEAGSIPAPAYGPAITLDGAMRLLAAARAEAVRLGYPGCTIAVTGPDGSLIAFARMDDTSFVSIQFAIAKARTAAISRRPTGPAPDGTMTVPTPDLIALPGGFPIIARGRTIGGIGISGTGGDVAIALAAMKAL